MFCPKCGKELPDGSAFCGGCGAKLGAKAAPAQATAKPAGSNSNAGSASNAGSVLSGIPIVQRYRSNPLVIVFDVVIAIAIICSFVPWLVVDDSVASLSSGVGGVASFFGASQASFTFEPSYSVWSLPALAETMSSYLSMYGVLGAGSQTATNANAISGAMSACALISVLAWVVALVLLIVGEFQVMKKQKYGLMIAGSFCMLGCAAFGRDVAGVASSAVGSVTIAPVLCILCSLAAAIGFIVLSRKAKKARNAAE